MKNFKASFRSYLNKLKFISGNNPKVMIYPKEAIKHYIPPQHKAVLIISCDLELIWAWRFAKQLNCDLEKAKEISGRERENVPLIIGLCEKFNIPITWAIVGHLLLKGCYKESGIAHKDLTRPGHFENKYWKFSSGDWFDNDPCCNWEEAKEWYAPDLIEKIKASRTNHEIACHSFSHIDCREEFCADRILRQEVKKCKSAASLYGIELKSFVFPGNFIGNLAVLKDEGFNSYRSEKDILGFPEKDEYGLWRVPTTDSIELSPYNWSFDYYVKRYKIIIERAIKYQRLCHFWFHPSLPRDFLEPFFISLFELINNSRKELYVTTMRDYCMFLESNATERQSNV